jgi:hypothetical protein
MCKEPLLTVLNEPAVRTNFFLSYTKTPTALLMNAFEEPSAENLLKYFYKLARHI